MRPCSRSLSLRLASTRRRASPSSTSKNPLGGTASNDTSSSLISMSSPFICASILVPASNALTRLSGDCVLSQAAAICAFAPRRGPSVRKFGLGVFLRYASTVGTCSIVPTFSSFSIRQRISSLNGRLVSTRILWRGWRTLMRARFRAWWPRETT